MVRKQMAYNLPAPAQHDRGGLPAGFHDLLEDVKARIRVAQTRAILAANAELVRLYWDIGRLIAQRKQRESWGAGVIPRLARELRNELPEVKGFSERNIKLMVQFAHEYPAGVGHRDVIGQPPVAQMQTVGKGQPLVAQIPWAHNVLLFYHLQLRAFVVIDLKKGKFKPEYAGKLNFYCNVVDDLSIYGQESNNTTWRLCKMNLAIRGIEGNIGPHQADTFHNDVHKDLKADFILANPPFNVSDWGGDRLREDARWKYGTPPVGNANFAWVQHMVYHLAPSGIAGFVLANGSMSSNQSGEGEIRRKLIEADLVDCMIALPGQLFYTTQIPACLWFLARSKKNGKFRDRHGQTLFIDARKMGALVDRTHRDLTDDDIQRIAKTYHAWRGEKGAGKYADVPGFCKSATLDEIISHGHVLTPGRYVGAAELEEDDEPFEEKMQRLTNTLARQFKEGAKLEKAILKNLSSLGFSPKEPV